MKNLEILLGWILVSIMLCAFAVPASAQGNTSDWQVGYCWNDSVRIQTDSVEKTNGNYSIRIENLQYNDTCVQRTFSIKKNTRYKFSAMVKYEDFSRNPNDLNITGASIGIADTYDRSDYCRDSEWTRLEYVFDSGNSDKVTLCLRNGMFSGSCCGTAWFSDIQLEENYASLSNEWSILAVVFQNIDADLVRNGRTIHCSDALGEADVQYLSSVLDHLYTSFEDISGGRMRVTNIDVVTTDHVITMLESNGSLSQHNREVGEVLDEYLNKGHYNQIIAISPVRDVADGWAGLGGGTYREQYFCQINYKSGDPYPGNISYFPDAIFVHEMLHCMEFASKNRNPEKTAELHGNIDFGFTDGSDEWRAWYTAYMRSELHGEKGLDPSVFMVYGADDYRLVSSDMTVNCTILSDSISTLPSETDSLQSINKSILSLSFSRISSQKYTGKACTPDVAVRDGSKTLKKGTDYTLTYKNNKAIGTASVTIKGKGNYSGEKTFTFKIVPQKTTLTAKKSNEKITLSWKKVSGAEKYQIYYREKGESKYKKLTTISGSKTSYSTTKLDKNKTYQFKIRSYSESDGKKYYSSYSKIVTTKS